MCDPTGELAERLDALAVSGPLLRCLARCHRLGHAHFQLGSQPAQVGLGPLAGADLLRHRKEIGRLGAVMHHRDRHRQLYHPTAGIDVAPVVVGVGVDLAGGQAAQPFRHLLPLLRQDEILRRTAHQLVSAIAGGLANLLVDPQEPSIRCHMRQADRRLVEGGAEARLGHQQFFAVRHFGQCHAQAQPLPEEREGGQRGGKDRHPADACQQQQLRYAAERLCRIQLGDHPPGRARDRCAGGQGVRTDPQGAAETGQSGVPERRQQDGPGSAFAHQHTLAGLTWHRPAVQG